MIKTNEIPWRRILIESATIIVSILLAFSIDTWWANKNNRSEEMRLLSSLRQELKQNVSLLEQSIPFRIAVRESALTILSTAEGVSSPLDTEELDKHIGSLNWWKVSNVSLGVLRSISQSGKLSLINDEVLRAEIASIESEYAFLRDQEYQGYETFKGAWMPYLYKHGHVAQLSNALRVVPGSSFETQWETPELPVMTKVDHTLLLTDREFAGIVTNIYWDQNDAIGGLERTIEQLNRIISHIDAVIE